MSASGKKDVMSEAELRQRSEAAQANVTHSAYAYQTQGEKALQPAGRSRLIELREATHDRQKLLELLQEKAADSVLIFELIESYVIREHVEKKLAIVDIPVVKYLPAFFNSLERAIKDLLYLMSDNSAPVSAELVHIKKVIDEYDQNQNDK
jgi:hypothetical protein